MDKKPPKIKKGVQVEIMAGNLYCHFFEGLKPEDIEWVRLRELEDGKPPKYTVTFTRQK
jgi:hypothetical protein